MGRTFFTYVSVNRKGEKARLSVFVSKREKERERERGSVSLSSPLCRGVRAELLPTAFSPARLRSVWEVGCMGQLRQGKPFAAVC